MSNVKTMKITVDSDDVIGSLTVRIPKLRDAYKLRELVGVNEAGELTDLLELMLEVVHGNR